MAKITFEKQEQAEEQIRDLQKEISYNVKDYPIGYIIDEFSRERFYIPDYQREFVWREKNKCRFIESLILGIPIPFMFVCEMDDGRYEIIDGAQRIQTIDTFIKNDFSLKKLEKLTLLNNFYYKDLPETQKWKLNNRSLRLIILEQDTSSDFRQEIFNRINTSWSKVNSAEVRRWTYKWEFMDFIANCATDEIFLELAKFSPDLVKRREPEELVLRYFAYLNKRSDFKHDVGPFLDRYLLENKDREWTLQEKEEFQRMLTFVKNYFPDWFSKTWKNQTPRVRFEAISIWVSEALRANPTLIPVNMDWLTSDDFNNEISTDASNSASRLNSRIDFVKTKLLSN